MRHGARGAPPGSLSPTGGVTALVDAFGCVVALIGGLASEYPRLALSPAFQPATPARKPSALRFSFSSTGLAFSFQ